MANLEHPKILKQGVEAWNKWRKENALVMAYFRGADLRRANLREANLRRAYLRGADLREANLIGADLRGADLREANLIWANLLEADLREADLREADLREADLGEADIRKADLGETDLTGAILRETIFGNVDLSDVKGLETVKHFGPSTIGIDTIYRSQGKIPEVFLRGCGVPDNFITFAHSLVNSPIEYYSCFISYSSKDEEFAQRLYADLQNNNVRCWFAPEDLKIGARIRDGIDEAIRVREKLLLVLSESSVASDWVEQEVETAMEEERKRKKLVLFPVRLDDAVFNEPSGWAGHIHRTRHIGNFCNWKQHDDYQKTLKRLLRDLKAESQSPE